MAKADGRATSSEWLIALVGLVGALLGALGGLTGSYMVYRQAGREQDIAAANRLADIRRVVYSDFVAQATSLRSAYIDFENEVSSGRSVATLRAQYRTGLRVELEEFARATASVQLVATSSVKNAVEAVIASRNHVSRLVSAALDGHANVRSPASYVRDFTQRLAQFSATMDAFTTAAAAEVV